MLDWIQRQYALLQAWMQQHETLLWVVGVGSAVLLVGSLLALPWIVARIPEDYFASPERPPAAPQHPVAAFAKNALGALLVLAGVLMLVLPGQGLLTILAGITLLEFPGKYKVQCRLVSRPSVLGTINWMRRRLGKTPLRVGAC